MKKILLLAFILAGFIARSQTPVNYTPSGPAAMQFKYIKGDSGLAVPYHDTTLLRSAIRPGSIVCRPADSLFYGWNGRKWAVMGADVAGLITLLNQKVDSVTVAGDSLWYWKLGVSYGYILPTAGWKLNGNLISSDKFFGTTNLQDIRIYTNNIQQAVIDTGGHIGIGQPFPDPHAMLDIVSTTAGVLLPRMSTSRRDGIPSPTEGLVIYNTTTKIYNYYDGTNWLTFDAIAPTLEQVLTAGGTLLNDHSVTNTGHTLQINGGTLMLGPSTLKFHGLSAGAYTDSVLIWNSTNDHVEYRDAASLGGNQNLQQVTDIGNATTNSLEVDNGAGIDFHSTMASQTIHLNAAAFSGSDKFVEIQNKAGTLALLSDLTGGTVTNVSALTLGTTGTDLTSSVANPTTTPVITLNVPTASASNRGALSSADWSMFNNKQATISVTSPITLTGASVGMVNQGTTTTVLHGNASGNPSFSSVSLTADVSGVLPIANGGTNNGSLSVTNGNLFYSDGSKLVGLGIGTTKQRLGVSGGIPAWIDTLASQASLTGSQGDMLYFSGTNTIANLSKNTSSTRYLSNTGTSNNPAWAQIDLTNGVTGTLPIANGGTNNGSLSVTAGTVYYGDGTKLIGLAPGTSSQILHSGTTPSWKDTTAASGANALGTYLVQTATNAPANAQIMASLGTGIVKNTTTTGVQSIAINSDLPAMSATVGGAVPTPPNDATKFLDGTAHWTVPGITIETEESTTPVADNSETNGLTVFQPYQFFTLPTTYKFYIITGIEWKNGATVAGSVSCGVSLVDANPPVNNTAIAVANGMQVTQSGTSAVQRNSTISSQLIPGGTLLGAWLEFNNNSATYRYLSGQSSINRFKGSTLANANLLVNSDAWTAGTNQGYIKVYYKGVN